MTTRILDKARHHALRGEFTLADSVVETALNAAHTEWQPVFEELDRISGDCLKVGLDDVACWGAFWMLKLDKTSVSAHLRVINHYEREAAWVELAHAMDEADEAVPAVSIQRPFLNRHLARIRRKLGHVLSRGAN